MASNSRDEDGGSSSAETPKFRLAESVCRDWPSLEQISSSASVSPAWNTEDDDESGSCIPGTRPSDLYGKFTWKIENFSQINKRELRSNLFEVGGYKWYILVYPQGCDVCNHLSLFLCVADYDKLLPGWSHFAQFTIAVVNKDPKKSKYSDTLHRFCKKEHDWGWKKFMELSKVLDGFTVADTLVIKAQVQVIRENPHRPFRCLDCQYRRELIRVYLTNVEGICRRFLEEKREKIGKLMEDSLRWSSFQVFWSAVEENVRRHLSCEKADTILKAIVKCFFNEKEVTSTLVMDALYTGYRALGHRSKYRTRKINGVVEVEEGHNPIVWIDKEFFVLADDILLLLDRAVKESIPLYKDGKGPQNRAKDVCPGDDFGKDNLDREERRLTELGLRTVEMFVLSHLFSNRIEVAYLEAIALKRQEELIREEEAAEQAELKLKARREAAEKEKRNKKKQAKQRRNSRKEKDKIVELKHLGIQESRQREDSISSRPTISALSKETSIMGDDDDDSSVIDNVDGIVGTLRPAIEDVWEREGSEMHQVMEASFSGGLCIDSVPNGECNQTHEGILDDSSSTCSSDSILSLHSASNGLGRKRSNTIMADSSQASASRVRGRVSNDKNTILSESVEVLRGRSNGCSRMDNKCTCSTGDPDVETVIASLRKRVEMLQQCLFEKEELVISLQKQLSHYQHQVENDQNEDAGNHFQGQANSESPSMATNQLLVEDNKPNIDITMNTSEKPVMHTTESMPSCCTPNIQDRMTSNTCAENISETLYPHNCADSSPTIAKVDTQLSRPSSASDLPTMSTVVSASSPSVSNGTAVHTDPARPSSASGLPKAKVVPVLSQQTEPPALLWSVNTVDRLGAAITEPALSSSSSASSSTQQISSAVVCRNTAASVTRNSSTPLVASSRVVPHSDAVFRNDLQHANTVLRRGSHQLAVSHSMGVMTAATDESGLMPQLCQNDSDIVGRAYRADISGATRNLPSDSQRKGNVGFTFGTVTPEMLHSQKRQENKLNHMDNGHFEQISLSDMRTNVLDHHAIQQHDACSPSSNHHEGSAQQITALQARHVGSEIPLSGSTVPEEFPHLDIINELLDEDKIFGAKALNAFLQQAGYHNIQSPMNVYDYQRMYASQMGVAINPIIHGSNGAERSDGGLHGNVPQFSTACDGRIIGSHGDNMHVSSYTLPPLQCNGLLDSMPEHHWQGSQGELASVNGYQSDMDVLLGYPIQSHVGIPDCLPYTLGQNGYSVYSQIKHP